MRLASYTDLCEATGKPHRFLFGGESCCDCDAWPMCERCKTSEHGYISCMAAREIDERSQAARMAESTTLDARHLTKRDAAIAEWKAAHPDHRVEILGARIISSLHGYQRELYYGTCAACPNRESLSGCPMPCDGDGVLR